MTKTEMIQKGGTVYISGNTFAHKAELKKYGYTWDAGKKFWRKDITDTIPGKKFLGLGLRVEVEVAGVCYDHPCYSEVAQ